MDENGKTVIMYRLNCVCIHGLPGKNPTIVNITETICMTSM